MCFEVQENIDESFCFVKWKSNKINVNDCTALSLILIYVYIYLKQLQIILSVLFEFEKWDVSFLYLKINLDEDDNLLFFVEERRKNENEATR